MMTMEKAEKIIIWIKYLQSNEEKIPLDMIMDYLEAQSTIIEAKKKKEIVVDKDAQRKATLRHEMMERFCHRFI